MSTPTDPGRRRHYAGFYDPPAGGPAPGDVLLVVTGNCQAESLRILLDPDGVRSVRVPPVFELTADDVPPLRRLLGRATHLLAQPVRDDYHDLPLGTAQLAAMLPPGGRVVRAPIVRYAGLHPWHVVHHPDDTPDPPLVAYHDLRTLARALGRTDGPAGTPPPIGPAAVRAVGAASLDGLRQREDALDVGVSDVLARPRPGDMSTTNHPGERPLLELARRAADALGLPAPTPPARPLLDAVVAPVEPVVAEAWGLGPDAVTDGWRVDGAPLDPAEVERAHRRFYAAHPDLARTVWTRFAPVASALGLAS